MARTAVVMPGVICSNGARAVVRAVWAPVPNPVIVAAASTSGNASATSSRWRNAGKVFTVGPTGGQRFPGFQFGEDGRPRPVIAQVLTVLGQRLSGWELALWFTGSNGWLVGERPVDVLDSDAELVVEAAGHLADDLLS